MNTRVSDIARAAGVSHGTVFVHFESLEELIAEVVAEYGGRIVRRTPSWHPKARHLKTCCALTSLGLANTSRFIRGW